MIEISIVTPTYNRIHRLKKIINALENQNYPKTDFEVIVVSDGSTDGTNEYLKTTSTSFPFRPLLQENSGAAAARNNGVKQAQADVILFLDDDVLPDPDLVRKHVFHQKEIEKKGILLGPMLTPLDWQLSPWVAWEQAMLERQYDDMLRGVYKPSPRQFYTGNASIKKEFFFQNNGFDPQFRRAEDVEFAYRAEMLGAEFYFDPEIKVYHYAERSFESWKQIANTYGVNEVRFTYEKGIDWLLPQIFRECKKRNRIMQSLLPVFLDHQKRQDSLFLLLKTIGIISYSLKQYKLSRVSLSGIFNIQYYQGIADQLGGREKFFSQLNQS